MIHVSIELPRVGRKRLICTAVLSATASALWIAAPVYGGRLPLLPDADLTVWLVLWGVLIPLGVGMVTLLWMEWRIARERGVQLAVEAERGAPIGEFSPIDAEAIR
jgi:EamA domain-containing membrane protein RarD